MIFEGQFRSIDDQNLYYVKIGNTGAIKVIQDNDDTTLSDNIVCFTNDPVEISCDMEDTFENVYIRECSINLLSNFDIRPYVVASNYTDIPVEIRRNNSSGSIIFTGFVLPLSFNQPFAKEWNAFTLNCIDKLGILEYIKFPPLLPNRNYMTPKTIMDLILAECNFTSISYSIDYDHTTDTKINPSIFIGDSKDSWMNCKEVLEEIGKIYGCWFWQDGDIGKIENILANIDLADPHLVNITDYTGDDANISVSEAYNRIECTVDISSIDETFIDPFKEDYLVQTTERPECVLTEFAVKSKAALGSTFYYDPSTGFRKAKPGFASYLDSITTNMWGNAAGTNDYSASNFIAYEHYCQVLEHKLFDFGEHSYLTDGYGTNTTNAWRTLQWLYNNPGKGAFLSFATTDELNNSKDRSAVNINEMKNYLVIQVGGHGDNSSAEAARISTQIYNQINAGGICSLSLNNVNNMIPNDISTVNYIIISGKIRLNPVQPKTGIRWSDNNYQKSLNTVQECLDQWHTVDWEGPYVYDDSNLTLNGRMVNYKDNDAYYQNWTWSQLPDNQIIQGQLYRWPYNREKQLSARIASPILTTETKYYQYVGSGYSEDGESLENDYLNKIPIIACELKIGDKYFIEDFNAEAAYKGGVPLIAYNQVYKWCTYAECPTYDGQKQTWFTLGIDPKVEDYIIGTESSIQNTVTIDMGLENGTTGFAIPIYPNSGLIGEMTFKILGPFNTTYDNVTKDWHWTFIPWRTYTTEHETIYPLAHTENIFISDLKFELKSDNARKKQLNDDNDLVYYSINNDTYTESESFDCKLCTSLTTAEVNALGIDYNLNNSSILKTDNTPFYGMTYKNTSNVKLEEARVAEQYNIWGTPRNIIELSLKATELDKHNYKQNYTFNYVDGTYRIISREINLKNNSMKCVLKDLS